MDASEVKLMSTTTPRANFEFPAMVEDEFAFLSDRGMRVTESEVTRVRFELNNRLINVYHGRQSYTVGVEIGRWIDLDGERIEQVFPLVHLAALREADGEPDSLRAIVSPELLRPELHRLAGLLVPWIDQVLAEDGRVFDELSTANEIRFRMDVEGARAAVLRARAQQAWRRRELDAVWLAYTEIDQELTTVELAASERARLTYALRHRDSAS